MTYKKPTLSEAPRLRQYLNDRHKADLMSRKEWEKLLPKGEAKKEIDIRDTPFASMFEDTKVVKCVAEHVGEDLAKVTIYRDDPEDPPDERINKYRKSVFVDLRIMDNFYDLLDELSTDCGGGMPDFLENYVVFFPEPNSNDHHLPEIPEEHRALEIKKTKRKRKKRIKNFIL